MNSLPSEETIEVPVSELQAFFEDMIQVYNTLNEVLKEAGILRGRELAEMNVKASRAVKQEKSPIGKLVLLNAYIKQEIRHIHDALKSRPNLAPVEEGRIRQAVTKIQLRASAIRVGQAGELSQNTAGTGDLKYDFADTQAVTAVL